MAPWDFFGANPRRYVVPIELIIPPGFGHANVALEHDQSDRRD
jgi:hypothetical protein